MQQTISLTNQIIVITGAGRGLGAAYARAIAARGATVVVHDAGVDRSGAGGDETVAQAVADEIVQAGGNAVPLTQNLATKEGCEAVIADTVGRFGRIDALIHSAGLVAYKRIADTTDEEWIRQREVNIDAPFWLCRAAFPIMQKQGYGRIVLTVSGYGLKTFDDADVAAYGVGKGAQFGLMNMLASEGAQHNIAVNAISPVAATRIYRANVAATEMRPEAVAPAVVWLVSAECPLNGIVIFAANRQFSIGTIETTQMVDLSGDVSAEAVAQLFTT